VFPASWTTWTTWTTSMWSNATSMSFDSGDGAGAPVWMLKAASRSMSGDCSMSPFMKIDVSFLHDSVPISSTFGSPATVSVQRPPAALRFSAPYGCPGRRTMTLSGENWLASLVPSWSGPVMPRNGAALLGSGVAAERSANQNCIRLMFSNHSVPVGRLPNASRTSLTWSRSPRRPDGGG